MNYTHLKQWERPSCYIGATWEGWFVVSGHHRDSDLLTESNWAQLKERLLSLSTEIDDGASVIVVKENHWAVGWIEWLGIHESNTKALKLADELLAKLDNYPILNEEHFSNLEFEAYFEAWNDYGKDEFVRTLAKKFDLPDTEHEDLENRDAVELLELFESLIPSGEYYHSEGSGVSIQIRYAVERCTREDLLTPCSV